MTPPSPHEAGRRLLHAMATSETGALSAVLHPDVSFCSPAAASAVTGRGTVAQVLGVAGRIYGDVSVEQQLSDDTSAAVFFTATVGGDPLQVCYRFDVDPGGQIVHLDVLMRPVRTAAALVTAMMSTLGEAGPQ